MKKKNSFWNLGFVIMTVIMSMGMLSCGDDEPEQVPTYVHVNGLNNSLTIDRISSTSKYSYDFSGH